MTSELVSRVGALTETLHAVVYFAPEPLAAYEQLGLRGYWRGYFASRAAALGPASAELVTALFGGFAPAFVARAVPAVWTVADPVDVLAARQEGAAAALRRALPDADVSAAGALTRAVVESLDLAGRPMAAAVAALPRPQDPLAALWHDCTVLREHRGDGHLTVLSAAGLRWPQPHLLAAERVDPRQRELRGWSPEQWGVAARALEERVPTGAARHELETQLERSTDELAGQAYDGHDLERLVAQLEPLARAVVAEGDLPFPNAMGLLSPDAPSGPSSSRRPPGTPGAGA